METLFTVLFRLASIYSVSCGLIPSFSVKEDTLRPNDSVTNATTPPTTFVPQNSSTTTLQVTPADNFTIDDQLVVPRSAIANSSDILLSEMYKTIVSNTSVEANQVTTTSSTAATTKGDEDDAEMKVQDEIVVPKEAINNSTVVVIVTTSSPSTSTSNLSASMENAIVVPKSAITNNNNNNSSASNDSTVSPVMAASDTVEPNQAGLGPISVHKRSVNSSEEQVDSSALFEKYDKWTGPGAITSQEVRELKKKGQWIEQTTRSKKQRSSQTQQRKRRRRKRRGVAEDQVMEWMSDSSEQIEYGEVESSEDETSFRDTLMSAYTSAESNSRENVTVSTDSNSSNNVSDTITTENLGNVHQQHLKEDGVEDDDSVCAVNKDDEEATRVVTIFWRSVFCVIFVIIVVYPIYSYTRIYCLKRRKYAESISNERFVGSDSEISNATNDYPSPTTTTPTPTPAPTSTADTSRVQN